jgi:YHS domain-containing protein
MTTPDPGAAQRGVALDPVCGMEVEIATARHTTEYHGEAYYFCGKGCKLDFEDDPEKYFDPDYVPSM